MILSLILFIWAMGYIAVLLLTWDTQKKRFLEDTESTIKNFLTIEQIMTIHALLLIVAWPYKLFWSTMRFLRLYKDEEPK